MTTCPTCGQPVRIVSTDEGTSHFAPPAPPPDALRSAPGMIAEAVLGLRWARHVESAGAPPDRPHVCLECWQDWPCDTVLLSAELDRAALVAPTPPAPAEAANKPEPTWDMSTRGIARLRRRMTADMGEAAEPRPEPAP